MGLPITLRSQRRVQSRSNGHGANEMMLPLWMRRTYNRLRYGPRVKLPLNQFELKAGGKVSFHEDRAVMQCTDGRLLRFRHVDYEPAGPSMRVSDRPGWYLLEDGEL